MDMLTTPLCLECASLNLSRTSFEKALNVSQEGRDPIVRSSSFGLLKSTAASCNLCRLIFYALKCNERRKMHALEENSEWELEWKRPNLEYDVVDWHTEERFGSALYPNLKHLGSKSQYCIQLIETDDTDAMLRGRMIRPKIDLDKILGWIQKCKSDHGENCKESNLLVRKRPSLLRCVDVREQCVKQIGPSDIYIALSNVWGQQVEPRIRSNNFKVFSTPGAFATVKLPKTIEDAIEVTKALGYRYVWVASLGILQDREVEKLAAIKEMDAIYGNADLTIIEASGDSAQNGLDGWDTDKLAIRRLVTASLSSNLTVGVLPLFPEEFNDTEFASRAWTYQEALFAPRCLIFLNGFVYFSCRAALWREDFMAETQMVLPPEGPNTISRNCQQRRLQQVKYHVDIYTSKVLGFQSDINRAFYGIQGALAASMGNTRFLYGLPASSFDWAILWSGRDRDVLARREGFPSWSWMGFHGRISMAEDHSYEDDQRWLNEKTWIDWCFVEDGCVIPIWHPERDGTQVAPNLIGLETQYGDTTHKQPRCPTYNKPQEGNPYGRTPKGQFDFLNQYRGSHRPFGQPQIPSTIHLPYLSFSTMSCSYSMEPACFKKGFKSFQSFFILKGLDSSICGLAQWHGTLEGSRILSKQTVQLLVLSYATPGTAKMFPIDKLDGATAVHTAYSDFGENENYNHYSNRLNALLVKTKQETPWVVERTGIGIIYKRSLVSSLEPVCWKDVLLC